MTVYTTLLIVTILQSLLIYTSSCVKVSLSPSPSSLPQFHRLLQYNDITINSSLCINASNSKGLLSDLRNVLIEENYSNTIDLKAVAALLSNRSNMYDSSLKDCDGDIDNCDTYLESIVDRSKALCVATRYGIDML